MKCPKCHTENTACIDSRRYKCLECGERFTTQERVVTIRTERRAEDEED